MKKIVLETPCKLRLTKETLRALHVTSTLRVGVKSGEVFTAVAGACGNPNA